MTSKGAILESIPADDIRQGTEVEGDGICHSKVITLGEPIYRHYIPHFVRASLKGCNVGLPPLPPIVRDV